MTPGPGVESRSEGPRTPEPSRWSLEPGARSLRWAPHAALSAGLTRFLIVRLALMVALVVAAASVIWLITSLAPGDATSELARASRETMAAERARLDLDRPLGDRYARWLTRFVRFDLGTSFQYRQPVTGLVRERAVNSARLAMTALALAALVGLPLGAIAGSGRWRRLSSAIGAVSLVALSVPPLLTSLVLMVIAVRTGAFPAGGMSSLDADGLPLAGRLADATRHLVVPALALAFPLTAMLERLQAATVSNARGDRHVLNARALGLSYSRVLWRDLWRPTLAPVAGIFGLAAGSLLSGSLAVEIVTSWPGLGRLMFEALGARDVPLAAGCAAAAAAFLALWTTLADIAVWWLDPRTRAGASS